MSQNMSLFVERMVNGHWELADPMVPVPEQYGGGMRPTWILIGQNTDLFAVMNCYVSHSLWGGDAITGNQGLPPDMSKELAAYVERDKWNIRADQSCWMMMNDILNFNWHSPMPHNDNISFEDFVGDGNLRSLLDQLRQYPNPETLRIVYWVS